MLISLPESCLLTTSTVLSSYLGPFIKGYASTNHFRYQNFFLWRYLSPWPAGNTTSPLSWLSVSSWCVNATEAKPLIGSLTLTCCQLRTPAPPTSAMKSWLFCRPVCRERLGSNGRQCVKSTLLIKTFSGVCHRNLNFCGFFQVRLRSVLTPPWRWTLNVWAIHVMALGEKCRVTMTLVLPSHDEFGH